MNDRTMRFTFFEIMWVIIAFLLITIYFLTVQLTPDQASSKTPPYIILSEENASYRFNSGSYELSPEFISSLDSVVVPQIASLAKEHACDVIQVIGHTDGIGMKSKVSTLDYTIMPFLAGVDQEDKPLAGSNLDLGMLRAIAVARVLESRLGRMPNVKYVLPYSAGPVIAPDGTLRRAAEVFDDRNSRRVELRLTVAGAGSATQ